MGLSKEHDTMHPLAYLTRYLFAILLSVSFLAAATSPALAATTTAPLAKYTAPLDLNCATVPDTKEAREALKKYNLCGYGEDDGEVTPNTTVGGSCGTLSLYIYNSGGGYLQWKAEVTSSLGKMVAVRYSGYWEKLDVGPYGPINRDSGYIFTSDWLDIFPIYTGAGTIHGQIDYASSSLVWGGVCEGQGVVYDYQEVTP